MAISNFNSKVVSFQRQFNKDELECAANTTKQARELLNLDASIIIQGTEDRSSSSTDTGIGVPYSEEALKDAKFWQALGFNFIVRGPSGIRKAPDYSPYEGTVNSEMMIADLKALTTEEYGNLLSKETFNKIVKENPNKRNFTMANFDYAIPAHDKALDECYENFIQKRENINGIKNNLEKYAMADLKASFDMYKDLEVKNKVKDAMYQVLSEKVYGGEYYYPNWQGEFAEIDKNLYNPPPSQAYNYEQRSTKVLNDFYKEIDKFLFKQFIVDRQRQRANDKLKAETGISTIGDRQVAFSDRDVWANQKLFSNEVYLGCPPDMFSAAGQSWGFKFLDPAKLFDANGELGKAGEYLKDIYKNMLLKYDRIRIDHAIGITDPWVYPTDGKSLDGHRVVIYEILKEKYNIAEDEVTILKNGTKTYDKALGEAIRSRVTEDIGHSLSYRLKDALKTGSIEALLDQKIFSNNDLYKMNSEIEAYNIKLEKQQAEIIEKKEQGKDLIDDDLYILSLSPKTLSGEFKELYQNLAREVVNSDDPWSRLANIKDKTVTTNSTLDNVKHKILNKAYEYFSLPSLETVLPKYTKILDHILLPAVEEAVIERTFKKLDKKYSEFSDEERNKLGKEIEKAIIYEDLGVVTKPVQEVFKSLNLPGILHARYSDPSKHLHMYREGNEAGNTRSSVKIIGSHDDAAFTQRINELRKEGSYKKHLNYLTDELGQQADTIGSERNRNVFTTLKIARMAAGDVNSSKNRNEISLAWFDLFGDKTHNTRYNKPGTSKSQNNVDNWAARMSRKAIESLCDTLIPHRRAPNMLEALKVALLAKKDLDPTKRDQVVADLDYYSSILKEQPGINA